MHAVLLVEQDRRRRGETSLLDPGEQALADDVLRTWQRDPDDWRPAAAPTVAAVVAGGGDHLLLGLGHDRLQLHRVADEHHASAAG